MTIYKYLTNPVVASISNKNSIGVQVDDSLWVGELGRGEVAVSVTCFPTPNHLLLNKTLNKSHSIKLFLKMFKVPLCLF